MPAVDLGTVSLLQLWMADSHKDQVWFKSDESAKQVLMSWESWVAMGSPLQLTTTLYPGDMTHDNPGSS